MKKLLQLIFTLSVMLISLQGCAALVGGAAGAGVYGVAEAADEDEEHDD